MMQTQIPKQAASENSTGIEQEGIIVWDQKGVVVVWSDGHRTRLPWSDIRRACQCAECREQHENQKMMLAPHP